MSPVLAGPVRDVGLRPPSDHVCEGGRDSIICI